jgi:hypothetical protein
MSQSTPLNMLRRGESGGNMDMGNMSSDSQLVEDILKEMGDNTNAENQTNINSHAFQYAMDSSQVPPTKYSPPANITPPQGYDNYTQKIIADNASNSILGSIGINLSGASLKDKIMSNMKYPVLVFIICFLISLPEFNRFLFGFFPSLLLESGQVSIGGVLLKAAVSMILYSVIVMFI